MKVSTSVLLLFLSSVIVSAFAQTKTCPASTLCFVVDESGSIDPSDFVIEKKAVTDIATEFEDRTTDSTFGAAFFNENAIVVSDLTDQLSVFVTRVSGHNQRGGGTAIHNGLDKCFSLVNNTADPRIITLITDGGSDEAKARTSAINIKNAGIYITTIGVGSGVNAGLLEDIASLPEYFVPAANYPALIAQIVQIVDDLCEVVQPPNIVGCCGKTSVEADTCFVRCNTANDCPRQQKCFDKVDPETYTKKCCGITVFDAVSKCDTDPCFVTSDCRGDQFCYGIPDDLSTVPVAERAVGCCGLTSIEAANCFVQCNTNNDCPRDQKCFDNDDPPFYMRYCCGNTVFEAARQCPAECFVTSDCSGDQFCYGIPNRLIPSITPTPPPPAPPGCCGRTSIEADLCFVQCNTKNDCPRSQICYDVDDPPKYKKYCCGTTVFNAARQCPAECFVTSDCTGDQFCYGIPDRFLP